MSTKEAFLGWRGMQISLHIINFVDRMKRAIIGFLLTRQNVASHDFC